MNYRFIDRRGETVPVPAPVLKTSFFWPTVFNLSMMTVLFISGMMFQSALDATRAKPEQQASRPDFTSNEVWKMFGESSLSTNDLILTNHLSLWRSNLEDILVIPAPSTNRWPYTYSTNWWLTNGFFNFRAEPKKRVPLIPKRKGEYLASN